LSPTLRDFAKDDISTIFYNRGLQRDIIWTTKLFNNQNLFEFLNMQGGEEKSLELLLMKAKVAPAFQFGES